MDVKADDLFGEDDVGPQIKGLDSKSPPKISALNDSKSPPKISALNNADQYDSKPIQSDPKSIISDPKPIKTDQIEPKTVKTEPKPPKTDQAETKLDRRQSKVDPRKSPKKKHLPDAKGRGSQKNKTPEFMESLQENVHLYHH